MSISVSAATVRIVLDASVTGSACESHVLTERLETLPKTIETLLLDAGYDDAKLLERCQQAEIEALLQFFKLTNMDSTVNDAKIARTLCYIDDNLLMETGYLRSICIGYLTASA